MAHAPPQTPRGAALPLALILLAVLTVVAVAAVSLSGQERVNAAAYSRVDFVNQCAHAAQAKMWSEIAVSGSVFLNQPLAVTEIALPDGSKLTSPAHYDTAVGTTLVKDVVLTAKCGGGTGGEMAERDCTNNPCSPFAGGGCQTIGVRCVDPSGRTLELELGVRFAL